MFISPSEIFTKPVCPSDLIIVKYVSVDQNEIFWRSNWLCFISPNEQNYNIAYHYKICERRYQIPEYSLLVMAAAK